VHVAIHRGVKQSTDEHSPNASLPVSFLDSYCMEGCLAISTEVGLNKTNNIGRAYSFNQTHIRVAGRIRDEQSASLIGIDERGTHDKP